MTFKELYSELIYKNINRLKAERQNRIFVLLGQSNLLRIKELEAFVADIGTFAFEKDEEVFNKEWFSKTFTVLQQEKEYHLLSFSQFSYLIYYIDPSFFVERVVIIRDNLRQLFPIGEHDYLEKGEGGNIEIRPDRLPVYQAEQLVINKKYFFVVKTPVEIFDTIDIFEESKELTCSGDFNLENIDVSSDPYSLDAFVNDCIELNDFSRKVAVKLHGKQSLSPTVLDTLKKINALLNGFGGALFLFEEVSILLDSRVDSKTQEMLLTYWGENATFRNISVYKNPDINNEITELSQGLVVETIINEYENSKGDGGCRDLFLTAPTGSGKSLLFQLPAFYVSEKNDVVIVVSPLIALMKDQVNAIINDRNFNKVAYINSELSLLDREKVIESCKYGDIDLLYMSPELLLSYDITHFIGSRRLGMLVVDEAHLITTWGRDFRVDYWFLGNHIRKMRKYHSLKFPMVAVTATAIYGGANDMVFDSIDSLVMNDPHIFIGQVRRNDIEFIVNNYERFAVNYESSKISQTVDFIKKINELGFKTLVYTPYARHIQQILNQVNVDQNNIATGYYGSMDSLNKEFAYRRFKSGEVKVMISTKAFGMGVDISDIQVVYHHAPSGLLPDYVQEIGRVARKSEIKGFATLNYSSQDQRYTKALHGMSALRQYQIKEVLKKIHKTYIKNNKNRNLLLSVDDFGHIFENALDLDQKVLTALMMIEKDYLAKNRFNVILARPKKLFVKVYAAVSNQHLYMLGNKYTNTFRVIDKLENGNNIIELDLDKLWYDYFVNKSFPVLKREFYANLIFKDEYIDLVPKLKISFERLDSFDNVFNNFQHLLSSVQKIFSNTNTFFNKDEFREKLNYVLNDFEKAEKLSRFILSSYSGRLIRPGVVEPNAFLQKRKIIDGFEYRVFSTQYLASFMSLKKCLSDLFGNADKSIVEKYVTNKDVNSVNYVRLGYFLEILELATFEVKGGENPMVFIRVNDPDRIARDSISPNYSNSLLSKTLERHYLSNQVYDHFFLRSFKNSERWDFIEDFFLGADVDSLIDKYNGAEGNDVDIIENLKKKDLSVAKKFVDLGDDFNVHIFYPDSQRYYCLKDPLTIVDNNGTRTKKVSEWLSEDPIAFDAVRKSTPFYVNKDVFEILVSKLKAHHPEYVKCQVPPDYRYF